MYAQTAHAHRTQLGFLPGAAVAASAGLGPVGVAIVISVSVVGLYEAFRGWFQRGELRIAATAKAENFVDSVWGTRTPNSPPTQDSVSKLIEACQLDAAQEMINFLARQMYEKAKNDSYFDRWMRDYGFLTLTQVQNKLAAYRGYCAISNPPASDPDPVSCPSGFVLQSGVCKPIACPSGFYLKAGICTPLSPATLPPVIDSAGGYVPISSGLSGGSMFGILAALLAVIVISR